jgi:hypothetical protein
MSDDNILELEQNNRITLIVIACITSVVLLLIGTCSYESHSETKMIRDLSKECFQRGGNPVIGSDACPACGPNSFKCVLTPSK